MKPMQISIDISAPVALVWSVMTDVERWPEWTPSVSRIQLHTPGPLRIGSRARIHQPKLPPAWWCVTELEPESQFTWTHTAPGLRVIARHEVEQTISGSRATLSIRHEGILGPLLARWTREMTARYVRMEADGLKKRCTESAKDEFTRSGIQSR